MLIFITKNTTHFCAVQDEFKRNMTCTTLFKHHTNLYDVLNDISSLQRLAISMGLAHRLGQVDYCVVNIFQ